MYCVNNPLKYSDPSGFVYGNAWTDPNSAHKVAQMWEDHFDQNIENPLLQERERRDLAGGGGQGLLMWVKVQDKSGKVVSVLVPYNPNLFSADLGKISDSGKGGKLKRLYGWSIDIVVTDGAGYSIEWGEIYDPNSKKYIQFFSKGPAFGADNLIGLNFIWIKPNGDFKLSDLGGNGWGWSFGITGSYGRSGNSTASYPENTRFDTYTLNRIGLSGGPGIFSHSPSSQTYINITNKPMFHFFTWPGPMWF